MVVFEGVVWEYAGEAPWYFISLPAYESELIRERVPRGPGFGSVKVTVRIGATTWNTSVFPDKARGVYVLPVKRSIRDAEGLGPGVLASVELKIELD